MRRIVEHNTVLQNNAHTIEGWCLMSAASWHLCHDIFCVSISSCFHLMHSLVLITVMAFFAMKSRAQVMVNFQMLKYILCLRYKEGKRYTTLCSSFITSNFKYHVHFVITISSHLLILPILFNLLFIESRHKMKKTR